jgi:hypothetical protein
MNSARTSPVEPQPRRAPTVTWIALALTTGSIGCIEIDGGAAELSWSLRSFDGASVDSCDEARVDKLRLCWQPLGPDDGGLEPGVRCTPGRRTAFLCEEASGITGFDLEPGSTSFWIEPVCLDGEPPTPGTYQVPPPIVRTVEEGRIVTLNSLLLVVGPPAGECPDAGCTCVR